MSQTAERVPLTERLTITIPEAAGLLGVSCNTIRNRLADGTLKSIKVGERRLVLKSSLDALLAVAA